jgi:hypothetical protein
VPLEGEVTLEPRYREQTPERRRNRGVDEVQATVLTTKGAPCQDRAQTCRIDEVEFLEIEDDFAHPIGADGL